MTAIESLLEAGNYEEALDLINSSEDDHPLYPLEALTKLGRFEDVIELASDSSLVSSSDHGVNFEILLYHSNALNNSGKYPEALEKIVEAKKLLDNKDLRLPNEKELWSRYYNALGLVQTNFGELSKAEATFLQALDISKNLNNPIHIANIHNNLGNIYWHWGKIDTAHEYYKNSLELKQQINDRKGIASLLNNIGIILYDKGLLNEALDYYLQSLRIDQEIGNNRSIALTSANIGEVYRLLANYDLSFEYLSKGIRLLEQTESVILSSGTYYQLILTCLEVDDLAKAEEYLGKIKGIQETTENKFVNMFYLISKGLILMQKPRAKSIIGAQEIFSTIVNNEVVISEITVKALYHLCDLLIMELDHYGAEEVIEEIKKYSKKLDEIAEEQNSAMLRAQVLLIHSKLAQVQLDTDRAQKLLYQAQKIAEAQGYTKLAYQISSEHDKLLINMNTWKTQDLPSLTDRLERLDLDSLFDRLSTGKFKQIEIDTEDPIALLILDKGGNLRIHKRFSEMVQINQNLMGSFLSAINTFSQDIFQNQQYIERIKHGQFTLVLNTYRELYICYIFKGNSYMAEKKMVKILNLMKENDNTLELIRTSYQNPKLDENSEIAQLFNLIFEIAGKKE